MTLTGDPPKEFGKSDKDIRPVDYAHARLSAVARSSSGLLADR